MIGKKRRNNKVERVLVGENKQISWELENKIKKELPLFNELEKELSEAKITLPKPLKLNPNGLYIFSDEEVSKYVEQAKKYYITNSGLSADWLTEQEKLETIRKADTIDRISKLFKLIKYPLFHLNKDLFEEYVVNYIFQYVYHPDAISLFKNVRTIFYTMRDDLNFDEVEIRKTFKDYLGSIIETEFINTKIEAMAGVKLDNPLHSNQMRGKH